MELNIQELIAFLPDYYDYKGKHFPLRSTAAKCFEDGKFDNADLFTVMVAWALAEKIKNATQIIPVAPLSPSLTPSPSSLQPSSSTLLPTLESWPEEYWHPWFIGTLPGEPDSDWAPALSPKHEAITNRQEALPNAAAVRFMSGIHRDGPALVPAGIPITHNFTFQPVIGERVKVSCTDVEVMTPDAQPFEEFGHIRHSSRDSGPRVQGCAVTIRLNPELGKGILTYYASSSSANVAPPVSIDVLGSRQ